MNFLSLTVRLLAALLGLAFLAPTETLAQFMIENAFPDLTLADPVDLQSPRDGAGRLFAVELAGRIVVFPNDSSASTPDIFLDISARVERESDGGLFGVAFHPDYEENGYFYVNYTAADPLRKVISRFSVDPSNPNRANPDSELVLLEIPLEVSGHNGGQLQFGPDDYLYIATGDGNPHSADSSGNGQDPSTLTGAMIRIDVDDPSSAMNYGIPSDNPFVGEGPAYREEVYAYGLRNPWRFSFDSLTGDLWLGDVGAGLWEEINIIEKGRNYGWNILEGRHCFDPPAGCDPDTLATPIWEYSHHPDSLFNGRSVTGGYVYRGSGTPQLYGKYIFGDFVNGQVWALSRVDDDSVYVEELIDTDFHIVSFGVDADEELYVITIEDSLYRIRIDHTSSIEEIPGAEFSLRVFPNPSANGTTISFDVPRPAHVVLDIYNLLGIRVRRLEDRFVGAGAMDVVWNGRDAVGRTLPAGMYYVRLRVDRHIFATRAVVRIP